MTRAEYLNLETINPNIIYFVEGRALANNVLVIGEEFPVLISLSLDTDDTFIAEGVEGSVSVTVVEPLVYAGTYTFDSIDLDLGPVNLTTPIITGDIFTGETVSVTPGLWVYDPLVGGISQPSYQWQKDDQGNGIYSNILGATSSSYLITSSDVDCNLLVIETVSDLNGSRSVNSTSEMVLAPP